MKNSQTGKAPARREENPNERVASMSPLEEGRATALDETEPEIDDRGTDQSKAARILEAIRDKIFDSSNERLALALGRPAEEIAEWINGTQTIDGDVLLKARHLALERGIDLEVNPE